MSTDGRLIFKSRRAKPAPLILTASMQRDAWEKDAGEACRLRDMKAYNRIIDALAAVDRKAESALSEEVINSRIDKIAMSMRQTPTVAELEESFDKEDDGNR